MTACPTVQHLLPTALLELPLPQLRVADDIASALSKRGLLTVGDLLQCARDLTDEQTAAVREALDRVLEDGLRQFGSATSDDWETLRAQLLGPLDDDARKLMKAACGIGQPPESRPVLQQLIGKGELDDSLANIRATLMQHCAGLLTRLHEEIQREFAAFDGVLRPEHAARGSLVDVLAGVDDDDRDLGLRLAAFCLPHECHLHRGVLHGLGSRRFRELLRTLPQIVPQHRLPLPVDSIVEQLKDGGIEAPRGVLLHVLRTELRTAIEVDGARGEVAVPDPRGPVARLVDILTEIGGPAKLVDLVFAYRERFRFASQSRLRRHLSLSSAFLRLGPDVWSLRTWHEDELNDVAELADATARRICQASDRQSVVALLRDEHPDERTAWLVLDRLANDPRVRMLGRGEACAADRTQSSVMKRLHKAFRRAAGEVVRSRFVRNQPAAQRRLVERLLDNNRAFVQVADDRIDTLTNYPFNAERMQRLIKLVREHLQQRTGYAQVDALKEAVDQTDLGGKWLSPELLADILRRNGPFEILPPDIVALSNLSLPSILMRSARKALREAGEAVTIADVVRARPDLAEFAGCLAELLSEDPLVQTPDGVYFVLA